MIEQISKNERVVVVCNHGAIRSRHTYNLMLKSNYQNIDYGGISTLSLRGVETEKLKKANVIISVHPYTTNLLKLKYSLESHQRFIELNVPDVNLNRGLRSVYGDLEKQIRDYLSE